jgi:hypothetical protein
VESSCEFGIEPSGSMKWWETIKWPNIVASQVVFSSTELVSIYVYISVCYFHVSYVETVLLYCFTVAEGCQ